MTLTLDPLPRTPENDGTRRESVAAGVLTLAALVAGCGGDDEPARPTGTVFRDSLGRDALKPLARVLGEVNTDVVA